VFFGERQTDWYGWVAIENHNKHFHSGVFALTLPHLRGKTMKNERFDE
jgi:hypothetical protein